MKTKTMMTVLAGFLLLAAWSTDTAIPANGNAGGPDRVPVLIGFNRAPGPSEQALVRSHGGIVKFSYDLVPAIAAWMPEPAIAGLRKNPNVTVIEPDIKVYAVDAELDDSWGVKRIGAGTVHDAGNKGNGVKVAIIDTGIDMDHEDLVVEGGRNYVARSTGPPWKRVPDPEDWDDDNGHGTHCAGTVAALDNETGVVGVAPEADLYALKVLGGDNSGYVSNVIAALDWAAANGIEVTNNSYGTLDDPGETFKAAFDNSADAGIVHVCASGNYGDQGVIYPAKYESCIAVGATDSSDNIASFSSFGPEVEVSAPGVGVYSTVPGGYGTKSGTSMASPHVAGVAALLLANGIGDVRGRLTSTAEDLGDPGPDIFYGSGLVDAAAAVGISVNRPPTVAITNPTDGYEFYSGQPITFTGTASDTEDGDITPDLVWTSDLDGQIGTGGDFSATLSDGTHTVTARVTDSGNVSASDSISITVGAPPAEPLMSVDSITYNAQGGKNQDKHLLIAVALVDDLSNPVPGASVTIRTDRIVGDTVAQSWTAQDTTAADGVVIFRISNAPSGHYKTTVIDAAAGGLIWDGTTPPNGYDK
jgi:subtilisin family serine protease